MRFKRSFLISICISISGLSAAISMFSSCGRISSAEAKGLPSGSFNGPHINDTQLKLIQSDHPTKVKLGWSSIRRNLRLGAKPTNEQMKTIHAVHKQFPTRESIQTMSVLSQAQKPELPGWNDRKIISKIQSQDIENNILVDQLEKEEVNSTDSLYSYEEFLGDAVESTFQQKPSLFTHPELNQNSMPLTASETSLSLNPGVVTPDTFSDITITSTSGSMNMLQRFSSQKVSSIDEFLNETANRYPSFESSLKTAIGLPSLAGNPFIQCAYLKTQARQIVTGSTIGNGTTDKELIPQYTCVHFKPHSPVSTMHGKTTRHQFTGAGLFALPKPGKHTFPAGTPYSFNDGVRWFTEFPSFRLTIHKSLSPNSRWIGVKLSGEIAPSPFLSDQVKKVYFPEITLRTDITARAVCKSGCSTRSPLTEVHEGWLIFGADSTGFAEIEVEGSLPLLNNVGSSFPFNTYVDVWEPSMIALDQVSDPSMLPELTQAVSTNEPLHFLNLWSAAMQTSNWIMPRLKHPELEGAIALNRLKLLRDSLDTEPAKHLLAGNSSSKGWLESVLVAHASVLIPRVEELLEEYNLAHASIALIKNNVDQSLVNLAGISESLGYQLIGYVSDGLKLDRVSASEIQSREELEESIFGAWELARDAEEKYRVRILLLCKTLAATQVSTDREISMFIRTPSDSANAICRNARAAKI